MNFLYCFDQNYNKQAGVSISSLAKNVSEEIDIFIIHDNPNSFLEIKKMLEKYKYIKSINVYEFKDFEYDFPNLKGKHVSYATYFRMFIENYLPKNLDYVIYLDADVVCLNNPINELKKTITKMKNGKFYISGVSEGTKEVSKEYFNNLGYQGEKYFNAGVVVVDFQKWISSKMVNSLTKIMAEKYQKIVYWDQDVLNVYFNGNYYNLNKILNYKLDLNSYDPQNFEFVKQNVIFLHYSGNAKPWSFDCVLKENSKFYQDAFFNFYDKKFHSEINVKKHEILRLFKLFALQKQLKNKYPLKLFLINLIQFVKKLFYYVKK